MQDKRTEWRESLTPDMVNHLVFLDESGVNIDLTRRYGRARSNCRVVDSTPLNTPRTQTVLAAIRVDGTIIPTTYEGGTTGDVFVNYLKDTLLPALRPGDIIIMDNLRSHHVARVAQVLADSGHEALYLPPYVFGKIGNEQKGAKSEQRRVAMKRAIVSTPKMRYP